MIGNPLSKQYASIRNPHYAKNGMVATSHPLAAQAGLDILKKGGNAVDAAIATAAVLTVVEPTSNGIGGDAFAIIWVKDKLYGLNSSGPSPKGLTMDALKADGHDTIPTFGFSPVTVPGQPAAWAELSQRFGILPFEQLLQTAIDIAYEGHAVAPTVSQYWQLAYTKYQDLFKGSQFDGWFEVFAPTGKAPNPGEIWRSPRHAKTLESIATTKSKSFYTGELADKMDAFSRQYGGYLRKEDLAAFKPEWVDPISVDFMDHTIWELPPNGQGICTLIALNILNNFDLKSQTPENLLHLLIESLKLAFADTHAHVSDLGHMAVPIDALLSESYARERGACIQETAIHPHPGKPTSGGTVYLSTADKDGNMVSYIQSNYMGFGSGLVVPETGIALQNRGHNFNLIPGHPNCVSGAKKPYHTIIPGFLTKNGLPVGPFGVMGGFMQPQGHLQVIIHSLLSGLNPQDALDAPRWQWIQDKTIQVEKDFPSHLISSLTQKGHKIQVEHQSGGFGRGQIIWRTHQGTYCGGTESRCDGHVASY